MKTIAIFGGWGPEPNQGPKKNSKTTGGRGVIEEGENGGPMGEERKTV